MYVNSMSFAHLGQWYDICGKALAYYYTLPQPKPLTHAQILDALRAKGFSFTPAVAPSQVIIIH